MNSNFGAYEKFIANEFCRIFGIIGDTVEITGCYVNRGNRGGDSSGAVSINININFDAMYNFDVMYKSEDERTRLRKIREDIKNLAIHVVEEEEEKKEENKKKEERIFIDTTFGKNCIKMRDPSWYERFVSTSYTFEVESTASFVLGEMRDNKNLANVYHFLSRYNVFRDSNKTHAEDILECDKNYGWPNGLDDNNSFIFKFTDDGWSIKLPKPVYLGERRNEDGEK